MNESEHLIFKKRFRIREGFSNFVNDINRGYCFYEQGPSAKYLEVVENSNKRESEDSFTFSLNRNILPFWLIYYLEALETIMTHKDELSAEEISYIDILSMLENWFKSDIKIKTEPDDQKIKKHFEGYINPQCKLNRLKDPIGMPFDANVVFADDKTARNVADEICAIKMYFVERYLLTDEFKKAEMTLLYLSITELSKEEKSALKKVTNVIKDTMLDKYFSSVFNVESSLSIHNLTFGNKGISARMKKYFSLDYRDYPDDPDSRINCIRLMAFLKGCELKQGNQLKKSFDSVKEKQNFYLNKMFKYATGDNVHTVAQSNIFSRAVTDIIFGIRKALDFAFIFRCYKVMKTINDEIRKLIYSNALDDLARKETDLPVHVDADSFSVMERFYMYMLLFEKRISLDTEFSENKSDDLLILTDKKKGRINSGWLYRQGVILPSEECSKKRNIPEKKPAKLGDESNPYDEASLYLSSNIMIRANDSEVDFETFFKDHLNGLVYFLCEDDTPEIQHKFRRRVMSNLNNVKYLTKCIYGNRSNMLSIYLCFLLYFSLGNIDRPKKRYHSYDTKTLLRVINSRQLSDTEIKYFSTMVSEMVKRVLLGDGTEDIDKAADAEFFQNRIKRILQILTSNNIFEVQDKLRSLSK